MELSFNTIQRTCYTRFSTCKPDFHMLKHRAPHTEHTHQTANQYHLHLESSWIVWPWWRSVVVCISSPFPMKEWCLGCWSLLQDWPNTHWTSGWPETCSWRLRSGSRTDLLGTEFPLYLRDMGHVINAHIRAERDLLRRQRLAHLQKETYLGGASAWWSAGPPDSVCLTVRETSGRGSCRQTAAPDSGSSSCKETMEDQ